jgi:hypothetical protein
MRPKHSYSLDSDDTVETAWYKNSQPHKGMRVADAFDEIKNFAYCSFDQLDTNGDGFISREELAIALSKRGMCWRERSFLAFLLRRIDDIQASFNEGLECEEGISRADIGEYFKLIRSRL